MLLMSTATGSRVAFHVYCHFLVAVEVAVEMAVDFQSGSRKQSGSRNDDGPKLGLAKQILFKVIEIYPGLTR